VTARWARRRAGGALAALSLALALLIPLPSARSAPAELAVKATYLYKLAPFAGWPASAFSGPTAPFVICVQGADPFRELLDDAVAGQQVGGRTIVITRLNHIDAASGCHLAYLGGSEIQPRGAALQALTGTHILTVTDESSGAGPRGMIHFVLRDGRVRFEIDLRQADAAGLTISSKLLALAVTVAR
jgi:hypothetical protein